MNEPNATFPLPGNMYDNCLIGNCISTLFAGKKDAPAHHYIISNNITDFGPVIDRLNVSGATELSSAYLSALQSTIATGAYRFAIVYQQNEPVLFCYFQLFTLTSGHFNLREEDKGFKRALLRFLLDLNKIKIVISGSALRNGISCYACNPERVNDEQAAILLTSVAEKIAESENAAALILRDLPQEPGLTNWLTAKGYSTPWQDNIMAMDIDPSWTTLSDYVSVLSRKYKARANKIIAAGAPLSRRQLTTNDLEQLRGELNQLFENVVDRQDFVLARLGKQHFQSMKALYGDRFQIQGYFFQGKLVAFYSAFLSEEAYDVYFVGLDYAANNEYQLYFNMLFDTLQTAIQSGKKRLLLGRTSFDAKASLGAKPVPLPYFIKTDYLPTVAINWFVNYFSRLEDGKWKLRHPMSGTTQTKTN